MNHELHNNANLSQIVYCFTMFFSPHLHDIATFQQHLPFWVSLTRKTIFQSFCFLLEFPWTYSYIYERVLIRNITFLKKDVQIFVFQYKLYGSLIYNSLSPLMLWVRIWICIFLLCILYILSKFKMINYIMTYILFKYIKFPYS